MTTYSEAIDLMFARLEAVVNAKGQELYGYVPETEYEGVRDTERGKRKVWLRPTLRTVNEEQITLGTDDSVANVKDYESNGVLIIQLFFPRSVKTALVQGRLFAEAVRNEFRKPSACIWYSNASLKPQQPGTKWYQINVTVDYRYDEQV